jgi:DNA-binding NarL/FixJ family response regulator
MRVLVAAPSNRSLPDARSLAATLEPDVVAVLGVNRLARLVDRNSVDVCLIAAGPAVRQLEAVRVVKSLPAPLPVLVVADVTDVKTLLLLLRVGVDGVVSPEATPAAFRRCLRAVGSGEVVLPRSAIRHLVAEVRLATFRDEHGPTEFKVLTRREREVLLLLYAGMTTAEVAARLFLSPTTVRSHLHSAQRRLRARSRDDLFRLLDNA